MSPRRNWDPPPPSECAPTSGSKGGGGHIRLRVRWWGLPIPTIGEKAQHSVYSVVRHVNIEFDFFNFRQKACSSECYLGLQTDCFSVLVPKHPFIQWDKWDGWLCLEREPFLLMVLDLEERDGQLPQELSLVVLKAGFRAHPHHPCIIERGPVFSWVPN